MSDLLPILKPLRGNFRGIKSLEDYAMCLDNEGKPALRFSIAIANVGSEDLHVVLGSPQQMGEETVAPGKQLVKQDDGGYREVDVGFFKRHEERDVFGHAHVHWLYKDLAKLELVDRDGQAVAKSNKEGYCVIDYFRLPDFPIIRNQQFHHDGCERQTEKGLGITVGWCDYYKYDTERQYIEIGNIPPGQYQIRFTINKTKMIYDTDDPALIEVSITEEDKKTLEKCADLF